MFRFLSFLGLAKSLKPLCVGDLLPPLRSIDQDGVTVHLEKIEEPTLFYFYPKANTPHCTKQSCSLKDSFELLSQKGIRIFGVSQSSPSEQKKFKTTQELPFPLLSDKGGHVSKLFGVSSFMGVVKRSSFLVREGKVIWRDTNPRIEKHAQDVLQAWEHIILET